MKNGLNTISFPPNQHVERRLNFFIDYYHYYVHFAGLYAGFDLDSPLSIASKLLYQLQHNQSSKCLTYVKNHLTRLADYPATYQATYDKWQPVLDFRKQWLAAGGRYPYLENNHGIILHSTQLLVQQLSKNLILDTVVLLADVVLSDNTITDDKEAIDTIGFHTRILASQIILTVGNKADARELFEKVFTDKFQNFPYPAHIKTALQKERYFKRLTLGKMFGAIRTFANTPVLDWEVNFKVEGLEIPNNYVFTHGATSMHAVSHPAKKALIKTTQKSKNADIQQFFQTEGSAIAAVTVQSPTSLGAYKLAKRELEKTLRYMHAVLGQNFPVNTKTYFYTTDKKTYGWSYSMSSKFYRVSTHVQSLLDNNAYNRLKGKKYASAPEFRKLEELYLQSYIDDDISGMWQYLEIVCSKGNEDKRVKRVVAGLLAMVEHRSCNWHLFDYLTNAIGPFNTNHKRIGLTVQEQHIDIQRLADFNKIASKVSSDLFKLGYQKMRTLQYARGTKKQDLLKFSYAFYYSTMEEAYEQRNHFQHAGIGAPMALTKLNQSLPMIIARVRGSLLHYAKKYPQLTREQLIGQVIRDIDAVIL